VRQKARQTTHCQVMISITISNTENSAEKEVLKKIKIREKQDCEYFIGVELMLFLIYVMTQKG
jgi:hypothetical protein